MKHENFKVFVLDRCMFILGLKKKNTAGQHIEKFINNIYSIFFKVCFFAQNILLFKSKQIYIQTSNSYLTAFFSKYLH